MLKPSSRRAASFVWFVMISIYFFFLGLFMSADVSRIIIAHEQVTLAAESAALAGASEAQLNVGSYYLNYDSALIATDSTFNAEQKGNAMSAATFTPGTEEVIIENGPTINPNYVEVSLNYQVNNLLMLGVFGVTNVPTFSANASAFLCIPVTDVHSSNPTGGLCTPPTSSSS